MAAGQFAGENATLRGDITLLDSDPYEHGWLYQVRGQPEPSTVDGHTYTVVLSAAIDGMLADRWLRVGLTTNDQSHGLADTAWHLILQRSSRGVVSAPKPTWNRLAAVALTPCLSASLLRLFPELSERQLELVSATALPWGRCGSALERIRRDGRSARPPGGLLRDRLTADRVTGVGCPDL